MTSIDLSARPNAIADEVFESGSRPEDIQFVLANIGAGKREFIDRLAIRAAFVSSDADADALDAVQVTESEVSSAWALYEEKGLANKGTTERKNLSMPSLWLAADAAFGGDMEFVLKLAGRHVVGPSRRFVRYVADSLGVAFDEAQRHFFGTDLQRGLVGAEYKASGKPGAGGVEDFETAVRSSKVPEELKAFWLGE